MRVTTTSIPPRAAADPQSHFTDDSGEQNGQSFAGLLTSMVANRRGSPDFTPAIGSHGTAFEQARMLVETAFDLTHGGGTARSRAADILAAKFETACDTKADGLRSLPASFVQTLVEWPTKTATPAISGAAEITRTIGDLRASHSFPPASAQIAPQADLSVPVQFRTPPGPGRIGASTQTAKFSAQEGASFRASGHQSPFGAQLAAFDGGLRLLLRLPRLAEGERHKLEISLAHLFESFGHRQHDIVIHEIAKGQE